jgi:NADH dehydrogenase
MAFVAAVRSEHAAQQLPPLPGNSRVARISYDEPESLRAAFKGASAVLHLPGILVESPGSTYEKANVETTRVVVEAARHSKVEKLVLVSGVGADEASANRYFQTKGEAEALVRNSGLSYTVLRVPLVLGRGTKGAAALQRYVSRSRARLIAGGRHLQQPLDVEDLAVSAALAAASHVAKDRTLNLVGPVSLPDREIVERAARRAGGEIRISSIPKGLVRFALAIRQRIGPPGFSVDALEVITMDTKLDPDPAAGTLGIRLTGLEEMIQHSLEIEHE